MRKQVAIWFNVDELLAVRHATNKLLERLKQIARDGGDPQGYIRLEPLANAMSEMDRAIKIIGHGGAQGQEHVGGS